MPREHGRRVHEQALAFLAEQGKRPQERACAASSRPRVQSIAARASAFMFSVGHCDRLVMVAEERDGAFFDHAGDGVDDVGGIGTVADVVAEEHEARRRPCGVRARDRRRAPRGCRGYR